ncbi:4Fe-4S dicluster domain-containing protein [Vagococcus intermedius]|uniref:4Fe-4S dicluster domain-containing protein n=1 Tax=Vagococcus intermedius TaxID=2991418 RepID=A0AAF0CTK8_9ENTE|nr:4Fe-4S dicluster domain-containing protein [Vagococcus intermedius]WEG72502.1 4Fe-4S dicluster domain-containing protein [Vagococcus intermedius]WEG74589.1 4Fe-4S dicluster domain-containing protein [Vagococcus intermedius]
MLLEKIHNSGIVGAGGAGFPTAKKLNAQAEYFIINAAECEPLLKTDHYVMKNHAKKCIEAITSVGELVQAENVVIATKGHYHEEIAALEAAISELNANITIFKMGNFYPAGDEQVIVYEVTGRTVPPGGIPLQVGCVVSNITTMLNVYEAMILDKPLTHKLLTITGEVNEPKLISVPIGTSFTKCLELAGGTPLTQFIFLNGGPMMGKIGNHNNFDDQVVTKTTSGIIVLEEKEYLYSLHERQISQIINQAKSSCIQCTLCTDLCPRYQIGIPLHPHQVMRHLSLTDVPDDIDDDPVWKQAILCCECGICEVIACPMSLSPRQVNIYVKNRLAEKGIRYKYNGEELVPKPMREYAKTPPKNILLKMGLEKYVNYKFDEMMEYESEEVFIPLKMHIGAPCQPIVEKGQKVMSGDVIATLSDEQLGAPIHASITGTVQSVGEQLIHIKKDVAV